MVSGFNKKKKTIPLPLLNTPIKRFFLRLEAWAPQLNF
jgi:hypothetical protein